MGVPFEFENNGDGWKEVTHEMIDCLELMDEDNVCKKLGFLDEKRLTREEYELIANTMELNKKRFFELFSKYFYDLWD